VLSALAEWNRQLVESLDLPRGGKDLLGAPPVGGGQVSTRGQVAPLTEEELRAALAALPHWTGTRRALSRTIQLPRANLDRVVARLDRLHEEAGRGPRIARPSHDSAVIVVWTTNVGAVTALDVDLAHRVEGAIDEVGAGIA
jgi:pterin-4a-carbinolamine dehydratase